MIANYFKIAWRNLIKDKEFSFLNILGLSTGLACVFLIYLWVYDELHVDKFSKHDAQLYQVLKRQSDGSGAIRIGENTQGLLATSMAKDFQEVETAVCIKKNMELGILSLVDKQIRVNPVFASNGYIELFSYPMLSGKGLNASSGITGIVLSDITAKKLFNEINVVGKTVKLDLQGGGDDFSNVYTIQGVFKAPPENASDQFDVILSFDLYAQKKARGIGDITYWGSNMVSTFLLLKPDTNIPAFNHKIQNYTKAKIGALNKEYEKYEGEIFIQKYSDRYLYGNYVNGKPSGGRIEYVKLFSLIALFILLIACINFMNLSTARASRRMKEVGVKKVMGASRSALAIQYLGEAMVTAFVALPFAVGISVLALPIFKSISGKELNVILDKNLLLSAWIIVLITGLIAGSYPALYLSKFRPVAVLKGVLHTSSSENWIRKSLVIFQFVISASLISSVIIVYQQLKLIQTAHLGYDKDHVLSFVNEGNLKNNYTAFYGDLKKIPGVLNVTSESGNFLGRADHSGGGIGWDGKDPNLRIEYYGNKVGDDFLETLNMRLTEGRTLSKNFPDSNSVLFNESAVKAMGLKNPLGQMVSLWGKKKQIVDIVGDYHFKSMYDKIGPAFIEYSSKNDNTLIKIKTGSEQQTLHEITNLFNHYNPGLEFNYSFMDDQYNHVYASEGRVSVLSKYFAGVAILISCLGLFGLSAFTAQKRQKEIGIRKAMGASVENLIFLLSKNFVALVCISLLITIPLNWWMMNSWLQKFAYRINISPFVFIITGSSLFLIALLTVSFQSIKAAIANPIQSLRTE